MFPPYNPKTWTPAMLAAPMMIPAIMTPRNGQRRGFDAHVQKTGREGSRPRAGAGNGNADEQHQCHEQPAPTGLFHQPVTGGFALFQAVGKELPDIFFIRAPVQHLPGEEIDQRHRQHIAHDAHRKRRPVVQIHAHGHNDAAPQLHQRHHGHEENQKIFGKHSITLM